MSIFRRPIGVAGLLAAWAAVALAAGLARAAEPAAADPAAGKATITLTPEAYYRGAYNNAHRRMQGRYTGDGWTWHARYTMDGFLDGYLATRDPAWLDAAVKYFDWTISLLLAGPDGCKGWLGPVPGQPGKFGEHPIGDAIMMDPMVRFAAMVLKDEPALTTKYGDRARAYVALAKELMFEKWQKRGTWHEDGPYGVFTEWPRHYTEQEPNRWHDPPAGTRTITLPFNMQVHWGMVAGRIHYITGEPAWRQKALKLFNFLKSRLCLYKDHYCWNYWEPFGAWDVDPGKAQAFRHWINTHAYRDYQAGEVRAMVEAYNLGLTFDAEDMKRLVNTNIKVMWTGSLDDIKWNNTHAGVQKGAYGRIRLASKPTGIFNRYAGTLWTDLVQFDATARRIYEKQLKPGSYQHAYYNNVTRQREPSYKRRRPDLPADVLDHPFSSCCTLTMVTVIPSTIERGKPAVVACLARAAGDLKIELTTADGTKKLATLREAAKQAEGVFNLTWQTKDTAPGRYRIRWTLRGEHRDFPITVR